MSEIAEPRRIVPASLKEEQRLLGAGVDLVLGFPEAGNIALPDDLLGHLVACLDAGGVVAVHAAVRADIDRAVSGILGMSGGGCA